MRISLFVFALLMGSSLFFACNNAAPSEETDAIEEAGLEADSEAEKITEAMADEAKGAWNGAMDAYHEVMADVFHSAEEGDLEPLKKRYQELASVSEEWANTEMPASLQDKGIDETMKELVKASADIAMAVEKGTDEEMTKAITDLHDVYHKIVGMCNDHGDHATEADGHDHDHAEGEEH
jgi:phage tail tape-measure protein